MVVIIYHVGILLVPGKEGSVMLKQPHIALCIALALLLQPGSTNTRKLVQNGKWDYEKQVTKTEGAFTYHAYFSKDRKEAWIYETSINGNKEHSILQIPEKINGSTVTCIGFEKDEDLYKNLFGAYEEPYHDSHGSTGETRGIKKITIPDSVSVIHSTAFCGMTGLKEVTIPANVRELKDFVFYGCTSLETLNLPDAMDKIDVSALRGCPKLKKIKISSNNKTFTTKGKFLLERKGNALIYAMPYKGKMRIPEGVKILRQNAFINSSPKEVYIPASVKKIEKFTFGTLSINEGCKIKNVKVSSKNKVFAREGQCIYNKKEKSLSVAVLNNKGVLKIPDKIENLTNTYSIVNYTSDGKYFKKVVFPKKLKTVTVPAFSAITDVRRVYFTGKKPPVIKNKLEYYASLPVFTDIYVPADSDKIYKEWYKKYDCLDYVDNWHTFNP